MRSNCLPAAVASALAAFVLLSGCSATLASREAIGENISTVLEVEKKAAGVFETIQIAAFLGTLDDAAIAGLSEHKDFYYVFYNAANAALADGKVEAYREWCRRATVELAAMEEILAGKRPPKREQETAL